MPLYSAAVRAEKSFVRLAEQGHGLLATPMVKPLATYKEQVEIYRNAFRPVGHHQTPQVVASLPIFVAANDAEAIETGDRLLAHYWKVWADASDSWNAKTSDSFPTYAGMGERLRSLPISGWRELGSAWFGSPERVADQIRAFHEQTGGVDGIIGQVDFGAVPLEVAERSLRLFIDEVLPRVADL
jgi:alkanesulfonate monooxygenase SsuD/methylene tetrahydromethanopterin reductase-like flavin-dependent oxidoreductase (luciferase family)